MTQEAADSLTIGPGPAGALVHIVTGGTGAGKTTYARALADRLAGVRFSIDEWMTRLFWMDSPQPLQFDWTMDRIGRCEAQIREQLRQLASRNVAGILDLGFTKAAHRAAFADFAAEIGTAAVLHWVDISADERWRRVSGRNTERGETFAMEVDRGMFDFMEGEWEAPTAEELAAMHGQIVR